MATAAQMAPQLMPELVQISGLGWALKCSAELSGLRARARGHVALNLGWKGNGYAWASGIVVHGLKLS